MRRRSRGFTLIELLVVVAIIGILAAIAITNYMNALARSRQKRTMADIRTIAQAWETRNSEKGSYTAAGFSFPSAAVPYESLQTALAPTYTRTVPRLDAWGQPYEYGLTGEVYAIRSPGRDGVYEGTAYASGTTDDPDCDIVYSNGSFVQYPENMQKN